MKHLLLAIGLLLAGAVATAQTTTTTAASLDCVPKTMLSPLGAGTQLRSGVATGGSWWGTWCPDAQAPYVHIVLNGYEWTSNRISTTLAALLSDADPLKALRLALAINSVSVQPADQGTWEAIKAEAFAALAADRPASTPVPQPAPAYIVGPATRADGTRPAYRYVNGVRSGTAEASGAQAGQPCDASRKLQTTSAGIWAPFGPAFAADIGTLCVPSGR